MLPAGSHYYDEDPPVLPDEGRDSCPEQASHAGHPLAGKGSCQTQNSFFEGTKGVADVMQDLHAQYSLGR